MVAEEAALPALLDPLLDSLFTLLPPPVYSVIVSILFYAWALLTSASNAALTIITTPPAQWDTARILPPLVTLFAAYFALVSLYRTANWAVRTVFWFVKWGIVLSALGALAGYIIATADPDARADGLAVFGKLGTGVFASLGGMILGFLNGSSGEGGAKGQAGKQDKPKAWDTWETHRSWQYHEESSGEGQDTGAQVQEVLGRVLGEAGKVVRESGWWEVAKGAADGLAKSMKPSGKVRERGQAKGDGSAQSARSR